MGILKKNLCHKDTIKTTGYFVKKLEIIFCMT